jgi:hypothetical protein
MSASSATIINSSPSANNFNVASNVFNPDPSTYFSTKGLESFLEIYTGDQEQDYTTLYLALYRGNERKTKFEVKYFKDGKYENTVPHLFVSSGSGFGSETYQFEKVKTNRFRITFKGNIDVNEFTDDGRLKTQFVQGLAHSYKNQIKTTYGDIGTNSQFFSVRSVSFADRDLEKKIDLDEHYDKVSKEFPLTFNKDIDAFEESTVSEKPEDKKTSTAPKKTSSKKKDEGDSSSGNGSDNIDSPLSSESSIPKDDVKKTTGGVKTTTTTTTDTKKVEGDKEKQEDDYKLVLNNDYTKDKKKLLD